MFDAFTRAKDVVEADDALEPFLARLLEALRRQPGSEEGRVGGEQLRAQLRHFSVREQSAGLREKLRELGEIEEPIAVEDVPAVLRELGLLVEAELFARDFDSVLATQLVRRVLELLDVPTPAASLKDAHDLFAEQLPELFDPPRYLAAP